MPKPVGSAMCVCGHKGKEHEHNRDGAYWCLGEAESSLTPYTYYTFWCGCNDFEFAPGQTWVQIHVTKPKKLKIDRCTCGHKFDQHTGEKLECEFHTDWLDESLNHGCPCQKFRSEVLSHG